MDHRERICFLEQFGSIGGGQRVLLDCIEGLIRRGGSAHVLCPEGETARACRALSAQVIPWVVPEMSDGKKSVSDVFTFLAFSLSARTSTADLPPCSLIVVNGPRTILAGRMLQRRLRVPLVLYLHGAYGGLSGWLIRRLLRRPDVHAIAPSETVAKAFPSAGNLHVFPHWVSEEFLRLPRRTGDLRSALAIRDNLPLVLVPGRFSRRKGQHLVLESLKRWEELPFHIVFSGAALFEQSGPAVASAIDETCRRDPCHIHRIDWQGSRPALFDDADLVIIPSLWEEPFGLVALEAMARARPLIVTDCGHLPHLAGEGTYAEVVAADSQKIADAIERWRADPAIWIKRAELAQEHVGRAYGEENLRRVLEFLASLA